MTLSNPVDSNCTFQSTYWCWSNICVNNSINTVMLFTLPLLVHCEFWEFESSVLTITPGKSTTFFSCSVLMAAFSSLSFPAHSPKTHTELKGLPFFFHIHNIDGWIKYLFHKIKKKKRKSNPWHKILGTLSSEGPCCHQCLALQWLIYEASEEYLSLLVIKRVIAYSLLLNIERMQFIHPW